MAVGRSTATIGRLRHGGDRSRSGNGARGNGSGRNGGTGNANPPCRRTRRSGRRSSALRCGGYRKQSQCRGPKRFSNKSCHKTPNYW